MGAGRPKGRPAGPLDTDVDRLEAANRSSLDIFGVENWPIVKGLTFFWKPEMPRPTLAWRETLEEGGGMAVEEGRRLWPCCEPPRGGIAKLWSVGSRPMASRGGRESGFSLHTAMNWRRKSRSYLRAFISIADNEEQSVTKAERT